MYTLQEYIDNKYYETVLFEGGLAGHMSHPIDYDDMTGDDLKDMVQHLFTGNLTEMKEKLDGVNIQATVNTAGEVVFIRNKGDLNSERGGMTIEDMANKWADKPSVAKNYVRAGEVIKRIFTNISNKFFNPDADTKVIVNCECISAGQTNVMIYSKDRVAFHGTATYKNVNGKWQLESTNEGEPAEVRKAADGIDEAAPRPHLVIKDIDAAKQYADKASRQIDKIFANIGISSTIGDYKKAQYMLIAPDWARNDECFNRLVNSDKTINLRELKKRYPELPEYEKSKACKKLLKDIMSDIDTVFSDIGNNLIDMLDGFTNGDNTEVVKSELLKQLNDVTDMVEHSGTEEMREVLRQSIARLEKLSSKVNAAEGVVFEYKGKLMKLTGSFSALNQIFGVKFMKH